MKMRSILFLSVLSLLTISVFAADKRIKGNKKIITQQIPITDYNAITVAGSLDFVYELSDAAPYLEVTVDENILPYLRIEVENSTLNISPKQMDEQGKRGNSYNLEPTKYKIKTNSRDLKNLNAAGSGDYIINSDIRRDALSINLAGSGDIHMKKTFAGESLSVSLAGSGDVNINQVEVNSLSISLASSGDIKVKGSAGSASYAVAGSGDIDAAGCKAQEVTASVAGSGDITLTATNTLKAFIKGSGDITYKGNPTILQTEIRGSGELIKR